MLCERHLAQKRLALSQTYKPCLLLPFTSKKSCRARTVIYEFSAGCGGCLNSMTPVANVNLEKIS